LIEKFLCHAYLRRARRPSLALGFDFHNESSSNSDYLQAIATKAAARPDISWQFPSEIGRLNVKVTSKADRPRALSVPIQSEPIRL
jgi:hypothetical protein